MVWAVSLSTTKLIPRCLTPRLWVNGIWSLVGVGKLLAPESIQSSTSINERLRLHLNAFRGEPAITGFVWHITPIHSSSDNFATLTSSGLHSDFIEASPWPWIAHPASGLIHTTIGALFRLAFAMAPSLK
jgi:hypothetical protein